MDLPILISFSKIYCKTAVFANYPNNADSWHRSCEVSVRWCYLTAFNRSRGRVIYRVFGKPDRYDEFVYIFPFSSESTFGSIWHHANVRRRRTSSSNRLRTSTLDAQATTSGSRALGRLRHPYFDVMGTFWTSYILNIIFFQRSSLRMCTCRLAVPWLRFSCAFSNLIDDLCSLIPFVIRARVSFNKRIVSEPTEDVRLVSHRQPYPSVSHSWNLSATIAQITQEQLWRMIDWDSLTIVQEGFDAKRRKVRRVFSSSVFPVGPLSLIPFRWNDRSGFKNG